ncbi:uncharacterized protein PV06_07013 [Exophiala oligosperma]|uniref:C2H2-type domain-containing protein n=1 Tax=Exophiala oligosperma TaxID=215243 RepID=A0A0D2ANC8_9EURO|nr:uncharacterized protein PV06_07013 [Exophiala oligosperma]KIW41456.1 hypothetical protein PV06_07013 [Exophiala oligosperma]
MEECSSQRTILRRIIWFAIEHGFAHFGPWTCLQPEHHYSDSVGRNAHTSSTSSRPVIVGRPLSEPCILKTLHRRTSSISHAQPFAFWQTATTMHTIRPMPLPTTTPDNVLNTSTTMTNSDLDYDILNNMNYLDDVNFDDFVLYPTNDIDLDDSVVSRFFPEFDFNPQSSFSPTPCSPKSHTSVQKYRCTDCSESFRRRCDLNRHRLKHDTPFRCSQDGCGVAFSEKRRCKQHEKREHGLLTEDDMKKCHVCGYTSIRPDSVKRHMRLRHGIQVSFRTKTSPTTSNSTVSPSNSEH